MNRLIQYTMSCCIALCALAFAACSDDDDTSDVIQPGQGEVVFTFDKVRVYAITSLDDMARLKVTLEHEGETIELPSVDLTGDEEQKSSEVIRLDGGSYLVKKYVAFNRRGVQVLEAYLDEANELQITAGEQCEFAFPIGIRVTYSNNLLRSTLFGICHEVFGNDSTLWPKSWREENTDFTTWENLDFEYDDYGNITTLKTITFDEKFACMKKLPAAVAEMATLAGIIIRDIPALEELPDNMDRSAVTTLTIINTSLREFPRNFEKMAHLYSLTINGSQLTELPERLAQLTKLNFVDFNDNQIASFPAALAKAWTNCTSLRMQNTQLTTMPEEIGSMKKLNVLDLCNNPRLSSLPGQRSAESKLRGLWLDGCAFTSIPTIATQPGLTTLSMANNQISSFDAKDVADGLKSLMLQGNPLQGKVPMLKSTSLEQLNLSGCGLTDFPTLSDLPALRMLQLADNSITKVRDNQFAPCSYLGVLDLSGNSSLTSFSNQAGFMLDKEGKPRYLYGVMVDRCPNLSWVIPSSWSHIENFFVYNKEGQLLPDRQVFVSHKESPKVSRAKCNESGCSDPSHDGEVLDLDEWIQRYIDSVK